MIAFGALRPALVGAQVLVTFGIAQVAGGLAAAEYQQRETRAADAAIQQADLAFGRQVQRSLGEGTPAALVDPFSALEKNLKAQTLPAPGFFVDQRRLDAMHQREMRFRALARQVVAVEVQTEVQLHQQLIDAINALRGDIQPARDAGIDNPDAYSAYADDTERTNQALSTPAATQDLIGAVKAKDDALRQATARKIAQNQALQEAKDSADYWLRRAQSALVAARAIPALKVDDANTAIAALAARLGQSVALADFQDIGAQLRTQALSLSDLVDTRQAAFDLVAQTRDHIRLAQQAGKDVSQDSADLDAAEKSLVVAADLPAVHAAKDQIQAIKNSVDGKYYMAIYGAGKLIIVSIAKEELIALQDGVMLQDTMVTTGRPSLPTVTGVFNIKAKYSPYKMHSPWPYGSQYWYPDVWMSWAMLFADGGYFIHDAPWRHHYGPGSDTEYGGTHGCVNVPNTPMSWLYPWTDMGTPVVVLKGDFGSTP